MPIVNAVVQLIERFQGMNGGQRSGAAFHDGLVPDKNTDGCREGNQQTAFNAIHNAESGRRRRTYATKLLPITKLAISSHLLAWSYETTTDFYLICRP